MTSPVTALRPRTSWNARELLAAQFPEPRWAVPGLVAEGLTLFVGAPKVGKSWASWNLAVAVASGGLAFGKVRVQQGDVLYLALEDTARRLQDRLRKVLGNDQAPDGLTVSIACDAMPQGAEQINRWLAAHPDARLVIVDVFSRIRGRTSQQSNQYDADYGAMTALKAIADQHGVAVLVVHHTRKAASDDFLDAVSGTQGLAGAADAIAVLTRSRGQADGVLSITGRDVEEQAYALSFAPDIGAWQMLDGPAQDYTLGDTRQQILRHLRSVDGQTPKQISEALGLNYETAKKTCLRMAEDGQLDTDGRGLYLASPVPAVPAVPDFEGQGHPPLLSVPETRAPDLHEGHRGPEGHPLLVPPTSEALTWD